MSSKNNNKINKNTTNNNNNINYNILKETNTNIIINKSLENDLTLVNNLVDSLQYNEARNILLEKIQIYPNNTDILDTLSEVLIALNEVKEAIKILKKSIEIEPNKNPEKYMSLGQLSDYKISLKCYNKGIELYKEELNNIMVNTFPYNESENDNDNKNENENEKIKIEKIKKIKNDLASAYSSIAELYMDSDLW